MSHYVCNTCDTYLGHEPWCPYHNNKYDEQAFALRKQREEEIMAILVASYKDKALAMWEEANPDYEKALAELKLKSQQFKEEAKCWSQL